MSAGRRIWKATNYLLENLVIPRPLAWLTIADDTTDNDTALILISGFTAACYTPLVIFMAMPTKFPLSVGTCVSMSLATTRETSALESTTTATNSTFAELGLTPTSPITLDDEDTYPPTVKGAPVQFFGKVQRVEETLVLIEMATVRIDASVLAQPSPTMRSTVTGKIDASRIDAMADLGGSRYRPTRDYRSMPRPVESEDSSWTSTDFTSPVVSTPLLPEVNAPLTWTSVSDGRSCALGFNPTTALVLSRPIGWISTYSDDRVPHLAPYSFFMQVGPDTIAFSAYHGNNKMKDAHKDAVETGCFCYNMCTDELAVPMNLSAAPLERSESEFALAKLKPGTAHKVDAPVVMESPVHIECRTERTIENVGGFAIVVGKVVGVSIAPDVLLDDGTLDVEKIRPITRLGYMDEYGVL